MTKKKVVKAGPEVTQVPVAPALSEAEVIWNAIKDRNIEMFALPNQIVGLHCTPFPVEPSKLYLTIRSTAVLPSLEAACNPDFTVEMVDRFVVVKRAEPSIASFLAKK
jgi:hypothetical protein